ncbi:MAG: CoA pyrophosphatase [Candidatus Latescibacterota bacterium]|nr:CoA pyrophosphatase [Candidatus Latescibacterota bacterium]
MYSIDKIKAELTSYTPNVKSSGHDAAVALILREQFNQIELLLIERETISGDPWSGQLAFPGGRIVTQDKDLCATAIRETVEETSIKLDDTMLVGRLDDETGSLIAIHVACFIFIIPPPQRIILNNEIKHFFWCSLDQICNPDLRCTQMTESESMPAVNILGFDRPLLWGLTYRFTDRLTSLLGFPLSDIHQTDN